MSNHVFGFYMHRREIWISEKSLEDAVKHALEKSVIIETYVQLEDNNYIQLPNEPQMSVSQFLENFKSTGFIGSSEVSFDEVIDGIYTWHEQKWNRIPVEFLPENHIFHWS
ncbi:hypothetical protein [Paenibacillus polymyxa]|uniref:hypothetical protein n=1 Tax=Paenibacillus polymyxa TaxID=1406 RepID=UPI0032170EA3